MKKGDTQYKQNIRCHKNDKTEAEPRYKTYCQIREDTIK